MTPDVAELASERLAGEGIRATAWGNPPGDRYPPHAHDYDKVLVAVEGSIVFRLTGLDLSHELTAGDRLDLPAGTVHAADVGPAGVRCLEGHLPAGSLGPLPVRVTDWVTAIPRDRRETDRGAET